MSAATAPAAAVDPVDQQVALAGRLCWHAVEICRALDHVVAEFQLAIAEATEHTDALIELALAMNGVEPAAHQPTGAATKGVRP